MTDTTPRQPIPAGRLIEQMCDDGSDYDDGIMGRCSHTWDEATGTLRITFDRDDDPHAEGIEGDDWGSAVHELRLTDSPDREADHPAHPDADLTGQLAELIADTAADHGTHDYDTQARDVLAWLDGRGLLATSAAARDAADQDDRIQVGAEAIDATPGTVLGYVVAIDDLDGRLLLDADGCFPASGMADAVEAAKESAGDDPRRRYFVAEIREVQTGHQSEVEATDPTSPSYDLAERGARAIADLHGTHWDMLTQHARDLALQRSWAVLRAIADHLTTPATGVPAEHVDVPMVAMPETEYEAAQARLDRLHQLLGLGPDEDICGARSDGPAPQTCLRPATHTDTGHWHRSLDGVWAP